LQPNSGLVEVFTAGKKTDYFNVILFGEEQLNNNDTD